MQSKEHLIYTLVLSFVLGVSGFFIGKSTVKQNPSSSLELNSLKQELLKQQYESKLQDIRFKMLESNSDIDNANPVKIDSLWSGFGF